MKLSATAKEAVAIREFVAWYCSEPRLAFNRTVVLRYRIHLEQRKYAPATIDLRLAAVRRIAYEAADAGLLSPELAAGIRRVKGVSAPQRVVRRSTSSLRTTCGAPAPVSAISPAVNWIRSSSCSATSPSRQPNAASDASRSSGLP
jgi:hypothetical protein